MEAKGAEGASVNGYSGIQVDSRGYAAVPYLSPYQLNDIRLDPKGTPSGVELENTSQKVAPHEGAVVKVSYQTRRGYPVLIKVMDATSPLIFGTEVYDAAGQAVGYVGGEANLCARRANKRRAERQRRWQIVPVTLCAGACRLRANRELQYPLRIFIRKWVILC